MSELKITLIDVGWGDSILLESKGDDDKVHYALIDSNDTRYLQSSLIFIKRYFEKRLVRLPEDKPLFDFVLLTHAHADHGQGLKSIMQEYGTQQFWYPKSVQWGTFAELIRFSNRSSNVQHHQSIDETKILPPFGDVGIEVLWPPHDHVEENENNNSVVLLLTHGSLSFILSGDAEEEVWELIHHKIPSNTVFFKVPHHGSRNGGLKANGDPASWVGACPANSMLAISSHLRPYNHPHAEVISMLESNQKNYLRTDVHYHICASSDGSSMELVYSH